jgi:DnaJ family protein A protein 3
VRGIHEDLNVSIPAGTSSHARIRLSGRGIQKPSGYGFGDHYVHVRIDAPKNLDAKQLALLRAYAELEPDTPGTIHGFTYDRRGQKIIMEDTDGLVADIKEALADEHNREGNGDKPKGDKNVA